MACTASIPEGLIALKLPGDPEKGVLRYREEVRHPALPFPKIARGTWQLNSEGDLIRHQETPEVEFVEIGETVLRIRKGEDGEPNMLPIPAQMKDLFALLRNVASQDDRTMQFEDGAVREPDPAGWRMQFAVYEDQSTIWLLGCESRLSGFMIRNADGIERRTLFELVEGTSE